ncbi:MAG: FHA domain-containing protein [Proteobacteria bacterium]|nr:FHA domain-containing protein [Pseudomonadota bacterium]
MSRNKRRTLNSPPDPDDTAEMPGLPPAEAGTDTWAVPHIADSAPHDDLLRAHQEEVDGLRANLATATNSLAAATASLAAATSERAQLEADLASAVANAQQLEQRLRDLGEELRVNKTQREDLVSQLQQSRDEIARLTEQREQQEAQRSDQARRDSSAHANALAQSQAALAHSQAEIKELRRRAARHQEVLQHTEGRRQIFDSIVRGHEETVADLAAQLEAQRAEQRALEARLAEQDQRNQTQAQQLIADGAVALTRARELEAERAHAREELANAQSVALVAQRRAAQLETDLADSNAAAEALREQLKAAEAAGEALRGDLAAAEDLIRSREAELQQHAVRIARLESQEAATEVHERILVCTEGDADIVHVLGKRTTVGRTPDNDMCIDADFISRHHAVVLDTPTGTVVEDLDSTNGVFVNNVRVTRGGLKPGDLVTFGRTTFRFLLK